MVTDLEVLDYFRKDLSLMTAITIDPILLQLDTPIQSYAGYDELGDAIEKYDEVLNVDISSLSIDKYYPWKLE